MSRTANLRERGLRASLYILARLLETHRGLLTLIWFLRFAALLGLGVYFVTNRSLYSEQILSQVQIALLAFLAYVTAVGIVGVYQPGWFVLRKVKLAQVVIEIGLYSLFYYLTGDPRSEVYFLYLLPLFVAVRYLGIRWTLGACRRRLRKSPKQLKLGVIQLISGHLHIKARRSRLPKSGSTPSPTDC